MQVIITEDGDEVISSRGLSWNESDSLCAHLDKRPDWLDQLNLWFESAVISQWNMVLVINWNVASAVKEVIWFLETLNNQLRLLAIANSSMSGGEKSIEEEEDMGEDFVWDAEPEDLDDIENMDKEKLLNAIRGLDNVREILPYDALDNLNSIELTTIFLALQNIKKYEIELIYKIMEYTIGLKDVYVGNFDDLDSCILHVNNEIKNKSWIVKKLLSLHFDVDFVWDAEPEHVKEKGKDRNSALFDMEGDLLDGAMRT